LLIAEATGWADPRIHTGRWNGHIWFEKLAEYLCLWQPLEARIVHYAGDSDVAGLDRLTAYRELMAQGRRIHPSQGPASPWELTAAMRQHLAERGYPAPRSVSAGRSGETFVVCPRVE
jgi:hypothetical protein